MRFLITAGGTREYIDPVRFISNASSGRMGYALVRAAIKAGHKVTLITAPVAIRPPVEARIINVQTAAQMFNAVRKNFKKCDCLIMAAAVADYTPAKTAKTKIKKADKPLHIKLKPTPDILKWAGKHKIENQLLVGFALEDSAVRTRAERKLKEKNLDVIVANTPTAIGLEKADVQMKIAGRSWLKFNQMPKTKIAGRIIAAVEKLFV